MLVSLDEWNVARKPLAIGEGTKVGGFHFL